MKREGQGNLQPAWLIISQPWLRRQLFIEDLLEVCGIKITCKYYPSSVRVSIHWGIPDLEYTLV